MSEPVSNTEIEDVLTSIRRLLAEDPKAADRGTGKRTEPSLGRGVEPSFFQGNEPTISRPSEAPVPERAEPKLTRPAEVAPQEPAKLVLTPAHRVPEAPVAQIPDVLRAPEAKAKPEPEASVFGATGPAEIPPAVEPAEEKAPAPDLDAVFDRIDAAEAEPPKPDPLVLQAEAADDLPMGESLDLDPIYEIPEDEQRPEPRRSFASAIFSRLTDIGQRDRAKPSDPGVARFTARESSVEPFTPRASEPKTPGANEPVPLPTRANQDLSLEDRIAELEAAVGAQDEEWEPDGSEMQSSGYVFDEAEEPAALPSFEAESSAFDTARDTLRVETEEVLTPSALAREVEAEDTVPEAELVEDDDSDEDDGPMADVLQSVIEKEIAAALARLEAKGVGDAEEAEAESPAEPVEAEPVEAEEKSPLVLRMPEADPAPLDATTAARRLTLGGLDLSRLSARSAKPEEAEADPLQGTAEADTNSDDSSDSDFADAPPKGLIFQTQNRVTPEVDDDWETEAGAAFAGPEAELPEAEEPSWDAAGGPLANSAAAPQAEYSELDEYDEFFRGPEDQPAAPEAWEPDAEFAEAEALLTGSTEPEEAIEAEAPLPEAAPLEPRSEFEEAEALLTGAAEPALDTPAEEPSPIAENAVLPAIAELYNDAPALEDVLPAEPTETEAEEALDAEPFATEADAEMAIDPAETVEAAPLTDEALVLEPGEALEAEETLVLESAESLEAEEALVLEPAESLEADETPVLDALETAAEPLEADEAPMAEPLELEAEAEDLDSAEPEVAADESADISEAGSVVEAAVEAALEAESAEPPLAEDLAEEAEEAPSKPEPLRLENPVEPLPEGEGDATPPENFEFVPEAPTGSTVIPLPRGEAERVRLETAAEADTPRIGDLTPPEPGDLMEADNVFDDPMVIDEDMLRDMVGDIIRQELQGELGERITRNVRKLVRREIYKALASKDFE